jgi:hypothetical protein
MLLAVVKGESHEMVLLHFSFSPLSPRHGTHAGIDTLALHASPRFTELGLLRLLTAEAVIGRNEVVNQEQAWKAYDRWPQDERVEYLDAPAGLFSWSSRSPHSFPKDWADSCLGAFAVAPRLTVVTFDQAFKHKAKELVLLKP